MMKKKTFLVLPITFATIVSMGMLAYGSWIIPFVDSTVGITVDKKSKIVVENYYFKNKKEDNSPYAKFVDLASAVESANNAIKNGQASNVHIYIISGSAISVEDKAITLNSGVSLFLPYNGKTVFTDNEDDYKGYINSQNSDSNSGGVSGNRKCLLQLINSSLTIEKGAELYIGGEIGTRGVVRYYSEVLLDKNSHIDCSGSMYAYGYIKESSTVNSNQAGNEGKLNNECDSKRYINFNNGSYLMTSLSIEDTSSGGTLKTLVDNNICPFNIFDFRNIQTYAKFENGASMDAKARLVVGSSSLAQYISETVHIINTQGNSALFLSNSSDSIADNYLSLEYCPSNSNGFTNSSNSPTKAVLNESVDLGSLVINASAARIDTSKYFLPISYKIHCYVAKNASFNIKNKIKFLPGSETTVQNGGALDNFSSMIFFKQGILDNADSVSSSFKNKPDAKLVVNGTLKSERNSSIGGYIETENQTGNAKLDFSQLGSQSNLTVSSYEGTNKYEAKVTSSGPFENDDKSVSDAQFAAGTSVTSSTSTAAWTGERISTHSLTVKVDTSEGFKYNVANYQIYQADDAKGTNQTELTSGSTAGDMSFDLKDGKYFKVVVSRAKSASFATSDQSFASNTYFKANKDFELVLRPNEGIPLNVRTENSSGAGTTRYSVSEDSTGYSVELSQNDQVILIKDKKYTFKVTNKGMGTTAFEYVYIAKGKGGTFQADQEPTDYCSKNNLSEMTKISETYNGVADVERTIFTTRKNGIGCFAKETMILLANGKYKPVEDLNVGEEIMIMNHDKGQLEPGIAAYIFKAAEEIREVMCLAFNNGVKIEVLYGHCFFDKSLRKYVEIRPSNVDQFINHYFYFIDNVTKKGNYIKLISVSYYDKLTPAYAVVSAYHMNCVANGLVNITDDIAGLYNYFDCDEKLCFDPKKKQADIEKYGLYDYSEWSDWFTPEEFDLFSIKYLKVSVGKGLLAEDTIKDYVNRYFW